MSETFLPPGPVLVSACLLGRACRYDGGHCRCEDVALALAGREILSICPESLGGLTAPRAPAEILGGGGEDVLAGRARVIDREGVERTAAFLRGAGAVLALARERGAKAAVLKERSPSCGVHYIYDGSFHGRTVPGQGVAAALLGAEGLLLRSEEDLGTQPGKGR